MVKRGHTQSKLHLRIDVKDVQRAIHPFINFSSFNKFLSTTYCVSGTLLGLTNPCSPWVYTLVGDENEQRINQAINDSETTETNKITVTNNNIAKCYADGQRAMGSGERCLICLRSQGALFEGGNTSNGT